VDRVCIFIDGSNFYHALKEAGWPVSVDFAKLAAALTGENRRHIHTFYYNTPLIRPRRDHPTLRRWMSDAGRNSDSSTRCGLFPT
jgi:hypothetical protein